MIPLHELPEQCQRQPKETEKAYDAFLGFLDLGPKKRSVRAAYRQKSGKRYAKQAPGGWNTWAKDNRWQERAKIYDQHEANLKFSRRQERIARIEDMAWEASQIMFQKAQEMSKFPIARNRQEIENGKKVVIIEPVKWTLRDIPTFFDMAITLAKAATGTDSMDEFEALNVLSGLGFIPEHTQRLAIEKMDELTATVLESITNPPIADDEEETIQGSKEDDRSP